jgi:hypothetical protein
VPSHKEGTWRRAHSNSERGDDVLEIFKPLVHPTDAHVGRRVHTLRFVDFFIQVKHTAVVVRSRARITLGRALVLGVQGTHMKKVLGDFLVDGFRSG